MKINWHETTMVYGMLKKKKWKLGAFLWNNIKNLSPPFFKKIQNTRKMWYYRTFHYVFTKHPRLLYYFISLFIFYLYIYWVAKNVYWAAWTTPPTPTSDARPPTGASDSPLSNFFFTQRCSSILLSLPTVVLVVLQYLYFSMLKP